MERWLILPLLSPAWQSHAEPSSEKISTTFRQCLDLPGSCPLHTDFVHPNSYTLFRLHLFLAASISTQVVYSCQSPSSGMQYPQTLNSLLLLNAGIVIYSDLRMSISCSKYDSGSGQNLLDQTSPLASSTLYVPGTLNYLHFPRIHQNFFLSPQIFITSISPAWKFLTRLTPPPIPQSLA